MDTDVEALAREVEALSPPDRLRLAASLMENRKAKLAHTIAYRVVVELGYELSIREDEEARK